jgi:predicted DNA-binding protein (UPF0251 family)
LELQGGQVSDLQRVLDVMMRATLTELQLCSHVPAQSFSPTASHAKPGTIEPTGDVCVVVFREQYLSAPDDYGRKHVIERCQAEVRSIKTRAPIIVPGENEVERRKRIVKETEGWEPELVAQSRHGVMARTIRQWRAREGRDPITGKPRTDLTLDEKKVEAARLWESGTMSQSEIAEALGLFREQVRRAVNQAQQGAEAA